MHSHIGLWVEAGLLIFTFFVVVLSTAAAIGYAEAETCRTPTLRTSDELEIVSSCLYLSDLCGSYEVHKPSAMCRTLGDLSSRAALT